MKEISQWGKISEYSPAINPTLVNKHNFDSMTEYGDNLLIVTEQEINNLDSKIKSYLHHLASINKSMPDHAQPIPL